MFTLPEPLRLPIGFFPTHLAALDRGIQMLGGMSHPYVQNGHIELWRAFRGTDATCLVFGDSTGLHHLVQLFDYSLRVHASPGLLRLGRTLDFIP